MEALHAIFVGYPNWQREWSWHHPIVSVLIPLSVLSAVALCNKIKHR